MQSAYIEYAMSVIVGRALPDVRDGLKPVHRRILYSMYEVGLTSDKPFKSPRPAWATCWASITSRRPVGLRRAGPAGPELLHALSPGGRPRKLWLHRRRSPAAYRYTEARMAKMANEMMRDIDKETVDWDPNFDESLKEPRVVPLPLPQPAGERLLRHCRGHDHQYPASQPAGRSLTPPSVCWRTPRPGWRT